MRFIMGTKAYMYVVQCADGTLYTGYTTDIERRIKTHNAGKGAKYTRPRLPVTLIYQESFPDKRAAMSAEALFKRKSREEKLTYIKHQQSKLDSEQKTPKWCKKHSVSILIFIYNG
ncbi:GIY-YIG catalytic domain protein [Streptococcus australis ATCC 700641]|uniref:GIY-YIG catalytic domain protein n=2 Tax=Streptococcus australis TaxID=113107 RepID=E7SCE7_9STRE|nr:GIY-YIG catalytic domain protein [Streptococcus australis ATCC 700641]